MNIFERIKFRYYISKKYTFRIHVGEYYKNRKYYKEKILKKKGFVKAKIADGYYTLWCNPNRITLKLGYEEDIIPYNDNSITSKIKSYIPINVCKECLENKKCKKYLDFLENR